MQIILLAAGYATRLYPLTENQPKPLLPVGGIPIIERILARMGNLPGLNGIHVVTNTKFAGHFERWEEDYRSRNPLGAPVHIHDDGTTSNDDRLGAVGDMKFVIDAAAIDDDILVVAGDNIIEFEPADLVGYAGEKNSSAIGLRTVPDREQAKLYGIVQVDEDTQVIDFEEKPAEPKSLLMSIGMYCYSKSHVPLITKYIEGGGNPDAPGHFVQWLYREIPLYGFAIEGTWYDIGDLASYEAANKEFAS